MLIDLHAHSSGISRCCRVPIEKVIENSAAVGIDGIVLTNHYTKNYVSDGDFCSFAKRYVAEYRYAKECGDAVGFKVFFGIEVTMEWDKGVHLLVYGTDDGFLDRHPTLFDYSLDKLYRAVKEAGGILIQAHPYRNGVDRLVDTDFLDGIEVNCHPKYDATHVDNLSAIAKERGLILSCGGDYHADTPRVKCGVYLPDSLTYTKEIVEYMKNAARIKLCVQEVGDTAAYDYTLCR